jgi:fructoselysine-6-P-deglycase FrlB-like protein
MHMQFIDDEIARQPQSWLDAARVGSAPEAGLPQPGERVAVVGCGTSWFMAEAYAQLRDSRGLGETDAFAASEFPDGRDYQRVVAISRSGTTTEVLTLLDNLRGTCPTTALTADTATPIVEVATHIVDLGFADERSVVQTQFATSALAALRAHLGEEIGPLAESADAVLQESLVDEWRAVDQFTFLGRGWAHGIAREAALKMREAAQAWTEAYPSMEYRHGPISIAGPNRVVWHFGPDVERLGAEVEHTGALFVRHPEDPQVDLIRVQRLAALIAQDKGLDPDRPKNLTRSVVLNP